MMIFSDFCCFVDGIYVVDDITGDASLELVVLDISIESGVIGNGGWDSGDMMEK